MTQQTFAARLRALRAGAGLTQTELARRAGLSRAQVNRLEGGRFGPTLLTLVALARALRCGVGELAGK